VARPLRTAEAIEAMRVRILDAAHVMIHAGGGPEAITMRGIAERLGISHMTLYSYFSSRQEMLLALRERHAAHWLARQREQIERARQGEVVDAVRDELNGIALFAEHRPEIYCLMFASMAHRRPGGAMVPPRHLLQAGVEHLEQLIRIGIEQGAFAPRDPELAALIVTTMVNGPLIFRASGRLPEDAPFAQIWSAVLEQAIQFLKRS